ncbi:MAG: hypothetical protein HY901_11180 [Deltaproteobacteria bacterium]|nr:hypothetical protein [Deltaproteobacteria bacterium]
MGLVFGALHLGARTGVVLGVLHRIGQLLQILIGLVFLAAAPRQRA